jgi:hypothetical protein
MFPLFYRVGPQPQDVPDFNEQNENCANNFAGIHYWIGLILEQKYVLVENGKM